MYTNMTQTFILAPILKKLRYKADDTQHMTGKKLIQNTVHYLHSDHLCKKTTRATKFFFPTVNLN